MSQVGYSGLAEVAAAELATHILPNLPPEQRYAGAMLKRALDVIRAAAAANAAPEEALERAGLGDARCLARALRGRAAMPEAVLRPALCAYVERKLEITNPRFLRETRATAKGATE